MSSSTSTSTHRLILLVLCLSLYACDARRLCAVDKKPQNKLHQTNKSSKEMGSDQYHETPLVPKMKNFSSKPSLAVTKGESTEATHHQKHHSSIPTNHSHKHTKADDDLSFGTTRKTKRSSTADGGVKNDKSSFVSVSWRVPRKKRGIQKQPGFNLDYSPPKTHPPSHN